MAQPPLTFFWHDYETFGADPKRDWPVQFAGVRTDEQLNIIEEPVMFYCRPSEDQLPQPEACLITGITPQQAMGEGVCEAEFLPWCMNNWRGRAPVVWDTTVSVLMMK